nr:photosystem I reaction center subunit VIII [Symphyocladia marchantioides]WAX03815.1 photosystem I reaction center subunit VIII [Symphyocladia marchantioides]
MTTSYLPSILVPLTGILFPGIAMALLFIYIEQDSVS